MRFSQTIHTLGRPMLVNDFVSLAKVVAREAGDYAKATRTGDLLIETKTTATDLVTHVDKRNEAEIRRKVLAVYPDHEFLGEEMGASGPGTGIRWIIDPIDGTINYAHGLPIWCVSIGIEIEGRIVGGAIYNPSLNEMFWAVRGEGAFLNDEQIFVSKETDQNRSLFVTGFPYNVSENPDSVHEQFVRMLAKGLLVRRLGSAALDLAYVACGRFEGFWEAFLSPWDTSIGQLLVREAGGRVTHYSGEDYGVYAKSIIASNGHCHEMILSTLAGTP